MKKTRSLYDLLAPNYRDYSAKKRKYINSVDQLILRYISPHVNSWLDVGSGDGVRAVRLAKKKGIKNLILSDPSREMVKRCKKLRPSHVWNLRAEELPCKKIKFNVITCLWNVLGHIENHTARVEALRRMSRLLAKDGQIFLDVNNRHNGPAYGWVNVVKRIFVDHIKFQDARGDAHYNWKIGRKTIPGYGHLFTPDELSGLIKEADLRTINRFSVDYTTGKVSKSPYLGQLFYILTKA